MQHVSHHYFFIHFSSIFHSFSSNAQKNHFVILVCASCFLFIYLYSRHIVSGDFTVMMVVDIGGFHFTEPKKDLDLEGL